MKRIASLAVKGIHNVYISLYAVILHTLPFPYSRLPFAQLPFARLHGQELPDRQQPIPLLTSPLLTSPLLTSNSGLIAGRQGHLHQSTAPYSATSLREMSIRTLGKTFTNTTFAARLQVSSTQIDFYR